MIFLIAAIVVLQMPLLSRNSIFQVFEIITIRIKQQNIVLRAKSFPVSVQTAQECEELRVSVIGTGVDARCLGIAFTANAMAHQVEAYMQAGFDDCLAKPLQLERLPNAQRGSGQYLLVWRFEY